MNEPLLLPRPKELDLRSGEFTWPEGYTPAHREVPHPAQGYSIEIAPRGVTLEASSEAGFFYAGQTLSQLREQYRNELPCVHLRDWPDYPVRGLYYDCARGKVPTLETLLKLAERCARYKLNQLQLYIEHTYAYQDYPEVWEGADPLTAQEIRALDARCAELHIELVPSFSTFGHFYTFIHTQRFQHLNELERDVSGDPFSWWDRMQHYTLDPRNPESIELIRSIIRETRPLFRSDKYNICCDETFDLGKGKNREAAESSGTGRLYLDFVKQIIAAVKEVGATPLMWADIVAKHSELMPEVPDGVVMLDWDYSANLGSSCASLLETHELPFYVCSGTSSWNRWLPDAANAQKNITRLARRGRDHGARGYLVTDWGDFGHITPLGLSYPGFLMAAEAAWTVPSEDEVPDVIEGLISRIELGDSGGKLATLLREAASSVRASWRALAFWQQPRPHGVPESWFDAKTGIPDMVFGHTAEDHAIARDSLLTLIPRIEKVLAESAPRDPLIAAEIRVALRAALAFEELMLVLLDNAGRDGGSAEIPSAQSVIDHLGVVERGLAEVWHARNKPSEYHRIREVLAGIQSYLEN